ncbi:NAD(P)-binding protein [Wolfiporia cocos MD-104 SS10]|uniref:NAD(P)-binding protein n=1 Tax=Wolfiporia cocos (strain MD-104) TaxID=742152 RepID=A0A2H3IYR9_WOLCO|nr:NAD(P)-binding protein [Wolfiporia cocos MD-104 SS10]
MPAYVIAGASRGLGLEFVHQLIAQGHTVIALARNPYAATGLTAIDNKNLHVIKADITDSVTLKAAAEETAKITGGSIDVLINNGAFWERRHMFHNILEYEDEASLLSDFNANWHTNVIGPILTTNAFLPLLRAGRTKKILTLSTGIADPELVRASGYAGQCAYSVSKCALEMVNLKFSLALKDEGFTCLAISPGVVNTSDAPRTPAQPPLQCGTLTHNA